MAHRKREIRAADDKPDPIVAGRCSALILKPSAHRRGARCQQKIHEGQERCCFHRGYTEPEIVL